MTFKDKMIHLIDFGFVSTYIDKDSGEWLLKEKLSKFRGNLLFAS